MRILNVIWGFTLKSINISISLSYISKIKKALTHVKILYNWALLNTSRLSEQSIPLPLGPISHQSWTNQFTFYILVITAVKRNNGNLSREFLQRYKVVWVKFLLLP